jgi:hypothetical protein
VDYLHLENYEIHLDELLIQGMPMECFALNHSS